LYTCSSDVYFVLVFCAICSEHCPKRKVRTYTQNLLSASFAFCVAVMTRSVSMSDALAAAFSHTHLRRYCGERGITESVCKGGAIFGCKRHIALFSVTMSCFLKRVPLFMWSRVISACLSVLSVQRFFFLPRSVCVTLCVCCPI